MKNIFFILIFFLSLSITPPLPLAAEDFVRTQDMINSILNEKAGARTEEQKISSDAAGQKKDTGKKSTAGQGQAPSAADASEVLLKTGIQFYNSALYIDAESKFKELLDKYQTSPYKDTARVWIGRIKLKEYRYDEATKEFSSIPAESGEYPAALFYSAEAQSLTGNTAGAIEYYQKVAYQFPQHEDADNALFRIGRIYLNQKNGNQALDAALRMIKYYPDRETIDEAYYLLGTILEKDETLKDIETCRKVFKLFIKKAERGDLYFSSSPLLDMVRTELRYIEKNYFRINN